MAKFNMVKTKVGNVPATDQDREEYNKLQYGEIFGCRTVNQRNAGFHRKFFAMCQLAWDNCPEHIAKNYPQQPNVPEKFWKELIKRAGYYDEQVNFKGVTEYHAKSIAFDNMGESEFQDLYSAVLDAIIKWIMPELDKDILKSELMNFM